MCDKDTFGEVAAQLDNEAGHVLDALVREGAQRMLMAALQAEVADYIERHRDERDEYGRAMVVRKPQQAERDREIREAQLARLEAEIDRLNRRRPRANRARQRTHSKAVCALKSHRTRGRFVRELKSGKLRIDRAAVRAEEKLDGKYLLSTTDPSLSADDIALGYKQLLEVERAFRTLKHSLELRPMHHRLPDRIRSHVLLCWLALLLIRVIETETDATWDLLRDELDQIHQVDLRSKDGAVRLVTELTANQRKPLSRLAIPPPKPLQTASLTP